MKIFKILLTTTCFIFAVSAISAQHFCGLTSKDFQRDLEANGGDEISEGDLFVFMYLKYSALAPDCFDQSALRSGYKAEFNALSSDQKSMLKEGLKGIMKARTTAYFETRRDCRKEVDSYPEYVALKNQLKSALRAADRSDHAAIRADYGARLINLKSKLAIDCLSSQFHDTMGQECEAVLIRYATFD